MEEMLRRHIQQVVRLSDEEYACVRQHFSIKNCKKGGFLIDVNGPVRYQERILSFLTTTSRERYEQLLRKQPALMQRVPKTLLAAYLGVFRETFSRRQYTQAAQQAMPVCAPSLDWQ